MYFMGSMLRLSSPALIALACGTAFSQTAPMNFDRLSVGVDTGELAPPQSGSSVVYSGTVEAPGADWVRVWFGDTLLPEGAELIVTSARSGHFHRLNARTLAEWSNSSAYLEGDVAFVDVVLPAGAHAARVRIDSIDAGLPPIDNRSICDGADDRQLSNDPRAARLAPQGCTAWLFNNRPNSAITADHCGAAGGDTLWFNVPLRTSGGTVVPPAPEHQYPVDGSSVQSSPSWSVGNDWAVFGVFNNSNTGLSPVDAQRDSYLLATEMPPSDGRPIRITGYGSTSFPVPSSWYAVQKTHAGPLFSISGSTVRYRPDTTGGNSGSAIEDDVTGLAIGIHTNGGCGTSSTSSNSGTNILNSGFRTGVMQPRGIADGPMPGVIRLLDDAPDRVDPAGGTSIGVELVADFTGPAPQSVPTLHTNDGSGWVETPMNAGFAGDWFAAFPSSACGADVSYYFSAVGADGTPFAFPPSAPAVTFSAVSTDEWVGLASADGESDGGWTIDNTGVTAGGWERGVPSATDRMGGPNADADGSGSCWTTGLATNVNLNGGPAVLTGPAVDLQGAGDAFIDVSLWMNADGSGDRLIVEASADGGAWQAVDTIASTPGWDPRSYRVSDFAPGASSVRMRFVVSDVGVSNTIEAGVDAFAVRGVACGEPACNVADFAPPFGVLDLADLQAFITLFPAQDPAADLAEPFGAWDLADVQAFVFAFVGGCP
jgi:hypothetical protein